MLILVSVSFQLGVYLSESMLFGQEALVHEAWDDARPALVQWNAAANSGTPQLKQFNVLGREFLIANVQMVGGNGSYEYDDGEPQSGMVFIAPPGKWVSTVDEAIEEWKRTWR